MSGMTLKQMEYFLSCATLLNFRKAAQLHYLSPPTLTRHISALEKELNVPLFVRDSHKVKLELLIIILSFMVFPERQDAFRWKTALFFP